MNSGAASAAITQALELLGRASQDWRNGTADVPGALHWPVAVNLARRELAKALEALGTEQAPVDTDKRAHLLRWLDRYGEDPRNAVYTRAARQWLSTHRRGAP